MRSKTCIHITIIIFFFLIIVSVGFAKYRPTPGYSQTEKEVNCLGRDFLDAINGGYDDIGGFVKNENNYYFNNNGGITRIRNTDNSVIRPCLELLTNARTDTFGRRTFIRYFPHRWIIVDRHRRISEKFKVKDSFNEHKQCGVYGLNDVQSAFVKGYAAGIKCKVDEKNKQINCEVSNPRNIYVRLPHTNVNIINPSCHPIPSENCPPGYACTRIEDSENVRFECINAGQAGPRDPNTFRLRRGQIIGNNQQFFGE